MDQLREVWKETDGLDPQEFNPKTFFKLHGKVFFFFTYIYIFLFGPQLIHKQPYHSQKNLIAFSLLDTNGDGVLDEQELEALFTKEVMFHL